MQVSVHLGKHPRFGAIFDIIMLPTLKKLEGHIASGASIGTSHFLMHSIT